MLFSYKSVSYLTFPLATLAFMSSVGAQSITPDATLGNESSVVNTNVDVGKGIPSDRIDGGATRGNNLFHSFSNFNVDAGRGAFFSNPAGIENIISRVTGSNVSNILGTLGVLGNANLFFANPNGIVFGPNARLDVSGSFFATTSDSFTFDNGFEFSASNPQAPPLLTVNIPIGLRFRDNPGSIINESVASQDTLGNPIGLQVLPGNTLALLGGDVVLDEGNINAPGARVEIGGLAEAGTIELENNDGNFQVNYPTDVLLSDVTLADDARVSVRASDSQGYIFVNTDVFTALRGGRLVNGTEGTVDGGDITVNSNEVNISGTGVSGIGAGIYQQVLDNASANTGNIIINTNSFNASSGGFIENSVLSGGIGNAGEININVNNGNFSLSDNALIDARTFGNGNAGSVKIQVENGDITLTSSNIVSNVESDAIGDAGEINLNANNIFLKDASQLQSLIRGQGNGAKVSLVASGEVSFTGSNSNGTPSGIFTDVETGGIDNAGDIDVQAGTLFLDGAQWFTSTAGKGDAGKISVTVDDSINITNNSLIFSTVTADGEGNGGNIDFKGRSFLLTDDSRIVASSFGKGDAGIISVNVDDSINIVNDSSISSNTLGSGEGNAGDINLRGQSLSLNDSSINSSSSRKGNAGKISVTVDDSINLTNDSFISSIVNSDGEGNAGDINFKGRSLSLNDSSIGSSIFGKGNGGKISVTVDESITLANNSSILSGVSAEGEGVAGDINFKGRSLSLNDSIIGSTIAGKGNGGKISLTVDDSITLANSSSILSGVSGEGEGVAGDINIKGRSLSLTERSFVDASSFSKGNAGQISLTIDDSINLASRSVISTSLFSGGEGTAGDINIRGRSLSLTENSSIFSSSSGKGDAGTISLTIDDSINLANSSNIASTINAGGEGTAGDINIRGRSLTLTQGSQIATSVVSARNGRSAGIGKAGNIVIDMTDVVNISGIGETGFSSGLLASAETGTTATESQAAGDITVTTGDFRVADGAIVEAATANSGDGGKITINARNFTATNGGRIVTSTFNSGNAGDIKLNIVDRITIAGVSSGIFASTGENSTGNGGNIDIDPKTVEILDGATVSAESRGQGIAGNINIVSDEILLLRRGGTISTASTTDGGNINIKTGVLVSLPNENSDITASAANQGGRITIDALGIFGFEFRSQQDLESLGIDNFSQLQTNDISATGGNPTLTGEIIVNNPEVDPNNGLIELPETVVDANKQIAQNPCKQGINSELVVTGRGGLPPNPTQDLNSNAVRVDLATPVARKNTNSISTASKPKPTPPVKKIVPAQGWVFNSKGQVVLTAYDPTKVGVQRTAHKGLCRAK